MTDIQSLAAEIPVEGEHALAGLDFITNGDQYLTFLLSQEQYAVDILCVQEIRSWEPPTKIPNAPEHVKGVINMRGIIVPIIDLRIKFNLGQANYGPSTVVIVLTIDTPEQTKTIGFVVDAVSDVLNAEQSEIKPALAFGGCIPQRFVDGMVNASDHVITLLNIQALQVLDPH